MRLGEEEEVEARAEGKSAGATAVPSEVGGAVAAKEGRRIESYSKQWEVATKQGSVAVNRVGYIESRSMTEWVEMGTSQTLDGYYMR